MFLGNFIPCLTGMYSLFELYTMSYCRNGNPLSSAETFYHLVIIFSTFLCFICQFFINEITASDAGPDIIRSHLFLLFIELPMTTVCICEH